MRTQRNRQNIASRIIVGYPKIVKGGTYPEENETIRKIADIRA